MAQRTTITAVRSVMTTAESGALSETQVQSAIDAGSSQVDRIADAACHTATSLELVERYLSADIAVQTSGGGELIDEKIGDASEKRNKSSSGESQYMVMARRLDCSGEIGEQVKSKALFVPFGGAGGFD